MRFLNPSILSVVCAAVFFSCASVPVTIPEGTSPAELVQQAQDASERGKNEQAVSYYQAILDRYPEDLPAVCAAEYEIAFIRYKDKDYAQAKAIFTRLLARYEGPDGALLPTQYKVLGEKILAIMEKNR